MPAHGQYLKKQPQVREYEIEVIEIYDREDFREYASLVDPLLDSPGDVSTADIHRVLGREYQHYTHLALDWLGAEPRQAGAIQRYNRREVRRTPQQPYDRSPGLPSDKTVPSFR